MLFDALVHFDSEPLVKWVLEYWRVCHDTTVPPAKWYWEHPWTVPTQLPMETTLNSAVLLADTLCPALFSNMEMVATLCIRRGNPSPLRIEKVSLERARCCASYQTIFEQKLLCWDKSDWNLPFVTCGLTMLPRTVWYLEHACGTHKGWY
jgi:hypothetical protein